MNIHEGKGYHIYSRRRREMIGGKDQEIPQSQLTAY